MVQSILVTSHPVKLGALVVLNHFSFATLLKKPSASVRAVNDSAPSAEVHCTRSSSLVGEPVFHGQPTVKPSAEQCDGLLASLRAASWPPNSSTRQSVSVSIHDSSGYYNFGVRVSDKSSLTAVTTLLPELIREVNSFISSVWPSGFWNAVCIVRNTSARPHRDLANTPNSSNLTVSLGAFQGGQLWVEDPLGKTPVCMPTGELLDGALHSTRNAPLLFPCDKWHMTFPFEGERWVITAYQMPGVSPATLAGLGFPSEPLHTPLLKRKLPPQDSAPQDQPGQVTDEVTLSAMRAQADKLLQPAASSVLPVSTSPRGPKVLGVSPEPAASCSPALAPCTPVVPPLPRLWF